MLMGGVSLRKQQRISVPGWVRESDHREEQLLNCSELPCLSHWQGPVSQPRQSLSQSPPHLPAKFTHLLIHSPRTLFSSAIVESQNFGHTRSTRNTETQRCRHQRRKVRMLLIRGGAFGVWKPSLTDGSRLGLQCPVLCILLRISSPLHQLFDLGQLSKPLCAFVVASEKWAHVVPFFQGLA